MSVSDRSRHPPLAGRAAARGSSPPSTATRRGRAEGERSDRLQQALALAAALAARSDRARATQAYLRAASMYVLRGQPLEAMAVCYRALQLCPEEFGPTQTREVLRTIGPPAAPLCRRACEVHLQRRNTEEAIGMLRLAAELEPPDPRQWERIGSLHKDLGQTTLAATAWWNAVRIYGEDGNNGAQMRVLVALLALDPDDAAAHRTLARTLLRVGEHSRALVSLSRLLTLRPADVVGLELMARALVELGRTPGAIEMLRQLVARAPFRTRTDEFEALMRRVSRWQSDDPEFLRELHRLQGR